MTVSASTPADIANLVLVRLGSQGVIGNLYEGSPQANKILTAYGQTRDAILRQKDWEFSQRVVALTLQKSAPVGGYVPPTTWSSSYPPMPWAYQYAYPDDCLKVKSVRPQDVFVNQMDPKPNQFTIGNDGAGKTILCNVKDALACYTARVTNPALWEPIFVNTLVDALVVQLAPVLGQIDQGKAEITKDSQAMKVSDLLVGRATQG